MVAVATKPESLVRPLAIEELEERLNTLITNYRDALIIVARQPGIGRRKTATRLKGPGVESSGRDRKRWVIRPFAQVFVESHIRTKIDIVSRALKLEAMQLTDDDTTKKLRSWTKRLGELKRILPGWTGPYGVLKKAPWVSIALPVLGAALAQFRSGQLRMIAMVLLMLGVVLLYGYVVFAGAVVGIGFRFKRAIFAGGETVPDLFDRIFFDRVSRIERWEGLPETNIYHAENQLFETLRIRKPPEFPLDLVVSIRPYVMFAFGVLFTIALIRGGGGYFERIVLPVVFWFALIGYVFSGISSYRERVRDRSR